MPAQPISENPDVLLPWGPIPNNRHNVRVLCDAANLTWNEKETISQVIHCESGYDINCVHPNIVNGHTASTDYSICQINDFYHIGPGKDFPSVEYVMTHPQECVEWMIRMYKAGQLKMWVCYLKGMYNHYTA